MFIRKNSYLRLVRVPERHGIFVRGDNVYEVMTGPGVIKTVPAKKLAEALGLDPSEPRNDLQECRRTARRLFRDGRHGDWVEYSTAIVVPGESLTAY